MSKCNCYECNPYGDPEPDQIDMMDSVELRGELRGVLKQRDELLTDKAYLVGVIKLLRMNIIGEALPTKKTALALSEEAIAKAGG